MQAHILEKTKMLKNKYFLFAFNLSGCVLSGILILMSIINFMLSWIEHEKSFISYIVKSLSCESAQWNLPVDDQD